MDFDIDEIRRRLAKSDLGQEASESLSREWMTDQPINEGLITWCLASEYKVVGFRDGRGLGNFGPFSIRPLLLDQDLTRAKTAVCPVCGKDGLLLVRHECIHRSNLSSPQSSVFRTVIYTLCPETDELEFVVGARHY